jgi:4-amino-4-deoxy-L-arabinose transferase-like glycosyltransferase
VFSLPKRAYETAEVSEDRRLLRRLRILFWCIAIAFGFVQAWNNRHLMNSDGICYLDLADAYLRGGYRMLLNAHWSPFYPWLLGLAKKLVNPAPYSEFTLLHLVNFVIYVFALVAFEFLLTELIAGRISRPASESAGVDPLPEWSLRIIGYLVFLWSSLTLITLERESPDMLMSVFVYLALAIILKIRSDTKNWYLFALLGVNLGIGYLAKAPMFPLAFVFLAVTLLTACKLRHAAPRVLVAFTLFLLVSAPLLAGLSRIKARLTFGDSGRWNYLTVINGVGPLWYMQDLGTARGKFQHNPQKVFDLPPVYAFVGPVGGTLPAWYDPSYWIDGVKPHFILHRQLSVTLKNTGRCFNLLFTHDAALLVALLIFCVTGRLAISGAAMLRAWPVWVPAIAALFMYSLVLVQERYIAVFLVVLWTVLFSSVRLTKGHESKKLVVGTVLALLCALGIPLAHSAVEDFRAGVRRHRDPQWEVAENLRHMGVHPGDKVGRIGGTHRTEWARLLRVQIIAEIPREEAEYFWSSDQAVRDQVIQSFRNVGATAIIAQQMPPSEVFVPSRDWKRVGDADFYAYLPGNNPKSSSSTQNQSQPMQYR